MTIRLGVLPYGISDSCRELRDALVTAFATVNQVAPRMIKTENSVFRGRAEDVIVNYGNRSAPAAVFGQATVLNSQASLNQAANKLTALNRMQSAGVSVIPFTTALETARAWEVAGETVYQRNTLTGHSGEGIVTSQGGDGSELSTAPLYTKGITGQRREWRVHIFKGVITYVQVKRRANGFQDNPDYREDVRNHHTGWIYATENINPTDAVLRNAITAVTSLGLDFGAVDIISRREEAWVLEVNTAPGLTGTTLETFTRNVVEFVNARRLSRNPVYVARFPTPAPVAAPAAPSAVPVAERAGEADAMMAHQVAVNVPNAGNAPMGAPVVQRVTNNRSSSFEDGYYMGTVQNQDGGVATSAILWCANGLFYRHGWNHPLNGGQVSQVNRLASVTTAANGTVIQLAFATQE